MRSYVENLNIWFAISLALFLVACKSMPVRDAEIKLPYIIERGQHSKAVQLDKIAMKVQKGEKIGTWYVGLRCEENRNLTWLGGKLFLPNDEFNLIFRRELKASGYNVVANSPKYLISGLINEVEAHICGPDINAVYANVEAIKGNAYLTVKWKIYSLEEQEIVYQTITEGSFNLVKAAEDGDKQILRKAFSLAVKNLAADTGFYNLVTNKD